MCRFDIIKRGETAGQPPLLVYHTAQPFSMKLEKAWKISHGPQLRVCSDSRGVELP